MSQENVELVYRGMTPSTAAISMPFSRSATPRLRSPRSSLQMEGGDAYRGHDGIRSWWENFLGVSPDFSPRSRRYETLET